MQYNPQDPARLFVDFWQEQMKHTMQDERYIAAMLDMLHKMQQSYMSYPGAMTNDPRPSDGHHPSQDAAASAASAPDAEHGKLSLLAQRVAFCEQRIADLERQLAELKPDS